MFAKFRSYYVTGKFESWNYGVKLKFFIKCVQFWVRVSNTFIHNKQNIYEINRYSCN